ncbi:MAG: hypothetical protein A2W99_02630 [Bacteroidetes bacterium GWF2_33_16]|nr:MAG: hypothetical protein A2X00_15525 [Bacteroidetes bacterium GWE2_32_14]OFY07157.1 MAG: hypothetical protein A2W99_02630 [Bacteroidetes bacterium GWF2_33_16]
MTKTNNSQPIQTTNNNLSEVIKINFAETDSVQILSNKDNSLQLLLVETITNAANPNSNIKFIVIDPVTKQIIYKNGFSNSLVKWHSVNELLLTQFFGIAETITSSNIKYFIIRLQSNEIIEVESNIINP